MSKPRPVFTGLLVHREPRYRYSFLVPEGWHYLEMESEHGRGAIYAPDPEEVATSFSVEGRDLGVEVKPEDLKTLRQGFVLGLRELPGSVVEGVEAETVGKLITMEARHTFREGRAKRKRWVRLLYQGSVQVRIVAQGKTVADFGYWEPMFFQSMRTFRFGDWWGEVTGADWDDTPFPVPEES
ncbi:MAG TPA: hypothetical protein VGM69_24345 [Chloroflexota bacterium]